MSDICNVDVMRKAFVFYYKSCRQKKKKNKAARKQPVKSDGMYLYVYFIFHILNIFIQGTNSISILFYNLALLKLKYLINYYK